MDAKTPDQQTSPVTGEPTSETTSGWDGLDKAQIRAKVQENSIARFEECEAARKAALDAGKSEDEAHVAAKAIWNAWAKSILARRKALEEAGDWDLDENGLEYRFGDYAPYDIEQSSATRNWILDGAVNFSNIRFTGRGKSDIAEISTEENDEESKKHSAASDAPVKSIFFEGARIDFSNYIFLGPAFFSCARFSGRTNFSAALFRGFATFSDARFSGPASFSDARFSGHAYFSDAQFSGPTFFSRAQFSGAADFSDAEFIGDATFLNARFSGEAFFLNARFSDSASFFAAQFSDHATFFRVHIKENASLKFNKSIFGHPSDLSKSVNFGQARFEGPVAFEDVTFHGPTSFRAMFSNLSFRLENTSFALLPDFREVRIAHRPELDGMRIKDPFIEYEIAEDDERPENLPKEWPTGWHDPRPLNEPAPRWWRVLSLLPRVSLNRMAYAPDPDAVAKFRALRGLAMQANDHEQEMAAFAGELRAQRFREHSPFDFRKGFAGRFWVGFLYQHIANFGRSFWRPLELWLGLTVVSFFAHLWAYLPGPSAKTTSTVSAFNIDWPEPPKFSFFEKPLEAIGNSINYVFGTAWAVLSAGLHGSYAWLSQWLTSWDNMSCYSDATGINPFISAVTLAVKNALLFLGGVSVERSRQAAMCLFGRWDEVTGKSIPHGSVLNPAHNYQFEPEIPWAISTLSSVQTLLSIILFFLFLLAVRNHFKIHD